MLYDTLNFRLTAADVCCVSFIDEVPCYLNNVATHEYSNGDVSVTGDLIGWNGSVYKVSVTSNRVTIKDCSLSKWFMGDITKQMTRADVQRAIESMSDRLHLPISRAAVTRLDLACDFIMQYPTEEYFNHLGELKNAKRIPMPNGVYFNRNNKLWQLCFYDKIREIRAKGLPIPPDFREKNVLRYELRYLARLPTVLGVSEVTGETLSDEDFWLDIHNRWRANYNAIKKINDINLNFKAMIGVKGLNKMGVLALVEKAGGELAMIAQINEARKRGDITTKQAYDLRQKVIKACQEYEGLTVKNGAITELTAKINKAVLECS